MPRKRKRGGRKLQYHVRRGGGPQFGPATLLLEHCTDESVRNWLARGQRLQQYNFKWFFELEAQRAAHKEAIAAALASVPGIGVDLTDWCRGIKYRYADAPLSCIGSLKQSGRFNYAADVDPTRFPRFPALYVARERETAYREMFGLPSSTSRGSLAAHDLALQKHQSLVWLSLRGQLQNVFDLTKARNLKAFVDVIAQFTLSDDVRSLAAELSIGPAASVNDAEQLLRVLMDPNWRGYPMNCDIPANGQVFGQLVSAAGFEGVLYQSTKTDAPAIAIFTRQFKNSTSWICVADPPASARCCRVDCSNFEDCERS